MPPLSFDEPLLDLTLYKAVCAALTIAGVPSSIDHAEYIELCLAFGFASFGTLALRRQKLDARPTGQARWAGHLETLDPEANLRVLLAARCSGLEPNQLRRPVSITNPDHGVPVWVALTPGRAVANVANAWEALLCSLDRFNR